MYIGVDLGGTNIAVGIVCENGNILIKDSTPTLKERPIEEIVADMAKLINKLCDDYGITLDDISGVGIGSPGTIDFNTGVVVLSNNLRMKNYPIADALSKLINKPVKVDNDANCAAMGEYVASKVEADDFILITLGTGVGSGIIANGQMVRGFNGAGGESGHMTIVCGGEPCTCGKRGCWEAYASVTALIRQTKEAMEKNPESLMNEIAARDGKVSGRTAFEAAKAGDKAGKRVVENYRMYIAEGLINMINIFQPKVVAIGGGISREGEYLLAPIREYVLNNNYNKYLEMPEIVTAKLMGDAGIVGAAMIAK